MKPRVFFAVVGWVLLAAASGCSSPRDPGDDDVAGDGDADADADGDECLDLDGDGAGVGDGCTADDCDDTDPGTTDQCGSGCADNPQRLGCPCSDEGGVHPCYHGPEDTAGRGRCAAGIQRCEGGVLGACTDQTLPSPESCDEFDDDCDGQVDDGVLNECGTCGACEQSCSGPDEGCSAFAPEEISNGILVTPEGWLTLGAGMTTLHVIWPSSSGTGEIFRVDTRTFEIEAAFWTGPLHGNGDGFGGGDSPSRTAVDDSGNVVISNRAFGEQGSLTKIAASEDDCVDRDHNGVIATSHSWDDKLDFDDHDTWDDECIMWHTVVGRAVDGVPRAVAIHSVTDLDGLPHDYGWVGLYSESKFVQFDVETGELTGVEAQTPGFTPYGSAIDRDGWLWATGLSSIVGRFDTADPEDSFETIAMPANGQGYRVIVDENNTPWFSGNDLYRYNRDDEDWTPVGLVANGGFGYVGNVASDGEGSLWVGTYADGQYVYRVSNDDELEFHTVDTPGTATFGTAVDFDGHAWAFGYTDGTATAIDVEDESTTLVMNDCGGAGCLSFPYVRGDITGLQRRNALNPRGNWSTIVEGCDATTTWTRVVIDADTPVGSTIAVSVKTTDDVGQMPLLEWIPIGVVPTDGNELSVEAALAAAGVDHGRYLAIQVILASLDRAVSPVLRGVSTQYGCSGGIE